METPSPVPNDPDFDWDGLSRVANPTPVPPTPPCSAPTTVHDFGVAVQRIGDPLRWIAFVVFVLMFVRGFVPWLFMFVVGAFERIANGVPSSSLANYSAVGGGREEDFALWVIAMIGIGLLDIARSLSLLRHKA